MRTQMDIHGKILIPSIIRNNLNLKPGDYFIIRIIDGGINILSLDKVIKEAQDLIKTYNQDNVSLLDEFLDITKTSGNQHLDTTELNYTNSTNNNTKQNPIDNK